MRKQKTPACDRGSMNKALDSFNSGTRKELRPFGEQMMMSVMVVRAG
jgi:hypothetical protein